MSKTKHDLEYEILKSGSLGCASELLAQGCQEIAEHHLDIAKDYLERAKRYTTLVNDNKKTCAKAEKDLLLLTLKKK